MRRGLVMAGLLGAVCATAAGCGSVVASSGSSGGGASTATGSAAAPSASGGASAAGASASSAAGASASASGGGVTAGGPAELVGCASVFQATAVSVTRLTRLVVPADGPTLMVTNRKPAQVQALFRDFCNAVTHPDVPPMVMRCPADFGTDYVGVFYDGNRVLARYVYNPSGCRRVGIIVGTITQSTPLAGAAASAAPHLAADFEAVLTSAKPTVIPTTSNMDKGPTGTMP